MHDGKGEAGRFAVLQPTTSLIMTLNFVKPCYEHKLNMSHVDLPLTITCPPMSHSDKAANVTTRPVSELEQFCSIHSLVTPSTIKPEPKTSSLLSALLGPSRELPLFSSTSILPWYPYTQTSVFKTSAAFQKFKECLVDSGEDLDGARKRAKFMADLRESYSNSFGLRPSPLMEEEETMSENEMTGKEEEKEESGKSFSQVSALSKVSSVEELTDWFQDEYEKFVSSSDVEIDVSQEDRLYTSVNAI